MKTALQNCKFTAYLFVSCPNSFATVNQTMSSKSIILYTIDLVKFNG